MMMINSPGREKMVKKASEALSFKLLLAKKSVKVCFVNFHMFLMDILKGMVKKLCQKRVQSPESRVWSPESRDGLHNSKFS